MGEIVVRGLVVWRREGRRFGESRKNRGTTRLSESMSRDPRSDETRGTIVAIRHRLTPSPRFNRPFSSSGGETDRDPRGKKEMEEAAEEAENRGRKRRKGRRGGGEWEEEAWERRIMAASRGDLGIGDDRTTTAKSPITRPSFQDSSVVSDKPTGKIVNDENKTGRVAGEREIQGRKSTADETCKNKSLPPVRDKASKNSNISREPKTSNAGIKGARSFQQRDDAYECSADQKRASVDSDDTGQIKKAKTRRKAEIKQGSISAKVIYKLVAPSNKQRRDFSPHRCRSENHANLIVVDARIVPSCGTSRDAEAPRKLDSCGDLGFWKTGSPRLGESRSSVRDEVGKHRTGDWENRGEPPRPSSYEKSYPRKCCGVVECEEKRGREANGRELGRKQESPVPPLLCRSRSLPRLSVHDSGVACSGNEQSPVAGHHNSKQQLAADLRQLHTLKQHYYPEGGWGWVVLLVGMLVQMLSHGVHGSSGILLRHVADKFGQRVYLETG